MLLIACFLLAMLIAVLLIPPLIRFAPALGLVDVPNERKVHVKVIPRVGGIAIGLGALLPIFLWGEFSLVVVGYVAGSLCILLFGVWDDRSELNYRIKFLGQIIAATLFIVIGGISIQWLPFQGLDSAPLWLSILLTFIALLGITNAVNLVDGLDGLAGGTSLLSLGAMALLAYAAGDLRLVMLALAVIGGVFGFLRYNTHPAVIFMGDTGSQFLGFSIGVTAILLTQQSNTALSPVLPLIILGLPILDTLTVMTRRIMAGRSPFSPDKNHFHHRLIHLGFAHYEAVIVIYLVQISLIVLGFTFKYQQDWILLLLFLTFCFGFNGLFHYAEHSGWRYRGSWLNDLLGHLASADALRRYRHLLRRGIRLFLLVSLSGYLLLSLCLASEVEGILLIYLIMLGFSLSLLFTGSASARSWLGRSVWYAACGLAVYCGAQIGLIGHWLVRAYLMLLALVILVSFLLETQPGRRINPLDFIVLACAGLMFYLSGSNEKFSEFGLQMMQAILFLYAVEFMLHGPQAQSTAARMTLPGVFAVGSLFVLW